MKTIRRLSFWVIRCRFILPYRVWIFQYVNGWGSIFCHISISYLARATNFFLATRRISGELFVKSFMWWSAFSPSNWVRWLFGILWNSAINLSYHEFLESGWRSWRNTLSLNSSWLLGLENLAGKIRRILRIFCWLWVSCFEGLVNVYWSQFLFCDSAMFSFLFFSDFYMLWAEILLQFSVIKFLIFWRYYVGLVI